MAITARFLPKLMLLLLGVGIGVGVAPDRVVAAGPSGLDAAPYRVVGLVVTGLERTSRQWLEDYIDYLFPATMTVAEVEQVQRKLLTTAVFSAVKVVLEPVPNALGSYFLHIHVEEKWTTIPVVRGVYGGGTPLRVVGMYDIHTFGELLTFGGEARKYGDAPPGFVLYFRNPRGAGDRYYLGAELWREFRRRDLYAQGQSSSVTAASIIGHVSTNVTMSRVRWLTPIAGGGSDSTSVLRLHSWKAGGDIETIDEAPSFFDAASRAGKSPGGDPVAAPGDLGLRAGLRRELKVLPSLLYDDIAVNNLEYDGQRGKIRAGPVLVQGVSAANFATAEVEGYAYKVLPKAFNLALRTFVGETTLTSPANTYFLGGLDTIRGVPDGIIYGTHAAYANFELRQIALQTHYLWLQPAVFCDAAVAGADWHAAAANARATAGAGVRLAVPQVYRLILRIDYGWSIDAAHSRGITAGLNQFFDPYIPL